MSIREITVDQLRQMEEQEGLILQGCGGSLQEWQDGINQLLTEEGILHRGTKFEEFLWTVGIGDALVPMSYTSLRLIQQFSQIPDTDRTVLIDGLGGILSVLPDQEHGRNGGGQQGQGILCLLWSQRGGGHEGVFQRVAVFLMTLKQNIDSAAVNDRPDHNLVVHALPDVILHVFLGTVFPGLKIPDGLLKQGIALIHQHVVRIIKQPVKCRPTHTGAFYDLRHRQIRDGLPAKARSNPGADSCGGLLRPQVICNVIHFPVPLSHNFMRLLYHNSQGDTMTS